MHTQPKAPRTLSLVNLFFCWIGAFVVGLVLHIALVPDKESVTDLDDAGTQPDEIPLELEKDDSWSEEALAAWPDRPLDAPTKFLHLPGPGPKASLADSLISEGAAWKVCAHQGDICPCRSGVARFGTSGPVAHWIINESGDTRYPLCSAESFTAATLPPLGSDITVRCECLSRKGESPIVKAVLPAVRVSTTPSPCANGQPQDFCGACRDAPRPRQAMCTSLQANISKHDKGCRMLWSCDKATSRRARPSIASHEVLEAQELHDLASEEICKTEALQDQLDVYLDCQFYATWAKYTKDGVEWLPEAYITYVGGSSKYAGQITNLVRSVHMFSDKPIVVVVIGHEFVCPEEWTRMKQLIVYRMTPLVQGISFNFNKIRAMVAARVVTGVELDSDQLIVRGMDNVFAGTRRECTPTYPYPILPVHFASLDAEPNEPYANYRYKNYDKPHGMRWCHAHPSWTYWALPFYTNILLINLMAWNTQREHMTDWVTVRAFDLEKTVDKPGFSMLTYLGDGAPDPRKKYKAVWQKWMNRDETSMNVYLWKVGAKKAWCKFDLEPCLYFKGQISLPDRLYSDRKWYPDGLPLIFWSMHNTKGVTGTTKVLQLIEWCLSPEVLAWTNCSSMKPPWNTCAPAKLACDYFSDKKEAEGPFDFKPLKEHAAKICCCMRPRPDQPFFWQSKWYAKTSDVPTMSRYSRTLPRKCFLP